MIHDLRRIAEKSEIVISKEIVLNLDTISRFNINVR